MGYRHVRGSTILWLLGREHTHLYETVDGRCLVVHKQSVLLFYACVCRFLVGLLADSVVYALWLVFDAIPYALRLRTVLALPWLAQVSSKHAMAGPWGMHAEQSFARPPPPIVGLSVESPCVGGLGLA